MPSLVEILQTQYSIYNCMSIIYTMDTSQIQYSLKYVSTRLNFILIYAFIQFLYILPICYIHTQQVLEYIQWCNVNEYIQALYFEGLLSQVSIFILHYIILLFFYTLGARNIVHHSTAFI